MFGDHRRSSARDECSHGARRELAEMATVAVLAAAAARAGLGWADVVGLWGAAGGMWPPLEGRKELSEKVLELF
eukprot:COSAG01_NODE_9074_length_2563_cov_514.655032_3_plen_74_part_00